ncbi:hypothetical protein [Pseudonocardia acaciae]|uniref:hypothetical protein n=1 Tax=Pseudonocardia acaciae TaxID=551276 RepID=UPI000A90250F|nr:hypothetical protein [Pseudonocardia acaciae]
MFILAVLVLLIAALGIGLLVAMSVRDEPLLGVFGLIALSAAGMAGSAYGVLTSA